MVANISREHSPEQPRQFRQDAVTRATQGNDSVDVPNKELELSNDQSQSTESKLLESDFSPILVTRSLFGGFLMGLANLVPGISGGTMLLAAGIYPQFIEALAKLTRFRFSFRSLLILGSVGLAAGLGILLLAGTLKELVINHRWIMYSLFIGLTLGGVPVVWRLARPLSLRLVVSGVVAFSLMALLAVLQEYGYVGSGQSNMITLFLAGLAGASAMILPGVSGGYLLLLLGQYVPILKAIDQFKDALSARDISAAMDPAISVLIPVGVGVVVGIVLVGNLLEWLLRTYKKETLGILLGLLVGSTVGLWPFREGVQPKLGDEIKAQVVTPENINEFDAEDWPTRKFKPSTGQIFGSLGLIAIGIGATVGVSMIGKNKPKAQA